MLSANDVLKWESDEFDFWLTFLHFPQVAESARGRKALGESDDLVIREGERRAERAKARVVSRRALVGDGSVGRCEAEGKFMALLWHGRMTTVGTRGDPWTQ
jgi:hypothetical protein